MFKYEKMINTHMNGLKILLLILLLIPVGVADQEKPDLYFDENNQNQVPQFEKLIEDNQNTFYIYANGTNSSLDYSIANDARNLCSVQNKNTGELLCENTHEIITGTSEPAAEQSSNYTVRIQADNNDDTLTYNDFNFTLQPTNDQATFQNVEYNAVAEAEHTWKVNISTQDLDVDYPLNYTLYGNLTQEYPNLLSLNYQDTNRTDVKIEVNSTSQTESAFTNKHQGNWTINVNVTDSDGANQTRPASNYTINVEVEGTNLEPELESLPSFTGTEDGNFTYEINATDPNQNDTLTFDITRPSDPSLCGDVFPWDITTTNSSTNATGLINETLNTPHVKCRYVNIEVEDQDGLKDTEENVFFNITNTNDAPTIQDVGKDGNISNQTGYLYAKKTYAVNVTDPDIDTYNEDEFANFTYSTNDSAFSINQTGSITYEFTNSSETGNYTVNVSVTDGYSNDSATLQVEMKENSPPQLSVENLRQTYNQTDPIEIYFNGTDPAGTPFDITLENLTEFSRSFYNLTLTTNTTQNGNKIQTWLLNMTENGGEESTKHVGTHSLNISLTDDFGATSSQSRDTINFTIQNENDAPFWDLNGDNTTSSTSDLEDNLGNVVVDREVKATFRATDYDLFLPDIADENLSFSYAFNTSSVNDTSFKKISDNEAELTFTPTTRDSGEITLAVNDSSNSTDQRTLTYNVLNQTEPPEIDDVKPWYNQTSDTLKDEFIGNDFQFNRTTLEFKENTTIGFDAKASLDQSVANNTIDYKWYVNDDLKKTVENVTPGSGDTFNYYFDFYSSEETQEVTLVVEDSRFSTANFTWLNEIDNVNRDPIYVGNLEYLNVSSDITFAEYFSDRKGEQRFYDPDDDPNNTNSTSFVSRVSDLSLNYEVLGNCGAADFQITDDDLRIIPKTIAQCKIQFNASEDDENQNGWVKSENVLISIEDVPDEDSSDSSSSSSGTTTETETVTETIEEEVDDPKPISLVVPESASIRVGQSIDIPVTLENEWDEPLSDISLSANASNETFSTENLLFNWSRSSFDSIQSEESVKTNLTVTNFRETGPYELQITADVGSPEFSDSATILVDSLERMGSEEEVQSRVTFARELLSENQECLELNEVIDRAQNALDNEEYEQAGNLVNTAINGCKHMVEQSHSNRRDTPGALRQSLSVVERFSLELVIGALVLTVLSIVAFLIMAYRE